MPTLIDHITKLDEADHYDRDIFTKYSKEEIEKVETYIDHDRDFLFTYAGLRQVVDKYLVQDRDTGKVYETPQFMYMMIVNLTIFREYPKETRLSYVKRYYDYQSPNTRSTSPHQSPYGCQNSPTQFNLVFWLMLMTPWIVFLVLICPLAMSHKGLVSVSTLGESVGSTVRSGEWRSFCTPRVVPFLKKFESTVRCKYANGIRGGSLNCSLPHLTPRDQRHHRPQEQQRDRRQQVRKLDYSIQISKLFYERFITNGTINIVLTATYQVSMTAFGTDSFDELYVGFEQDDNIPRSTVSSSGTHSGPPEGEGRDWSSVSDEHRPL